MKRRNFIKLSVLTAFTLLSPLDISANKKNKKTLVLIELDGGNDGLNTFVPYTSKKYYSLRPSIALNKNQLNIINERFGLNKNLKNLYKLYKEGNVALINGLGYEKPNLSHFKSIEIVETASTGNELRKNGWLSSSLEKGKLNEKLPANALVIGKRRKGYLFSNNLTILQIRSIDSFINKSSSLSLSSNKNSLNMNLDFLYEQEDSIKNANKSLGKYASNIEIQSNFEEDDLSHDFKEAVKIIKSDLEIPVIKLSQKGYDTHANQVERQSNLLKNLDMAINSLVNELRVSGLYENVLIMTYSEFGRRVKENASGGTDHGTASVQFILGGSVKGGVYGDEPSLDNLHKNNLLYTTDYKNLYNTILSKWFNNSNNEFKNYRIIDFL